MRRYMLRNPEALASHFGAVDRRGEASPGFNVQPFQDVPIVRQVAAERELVTVQWGLVPHWAKFARGQAIARAEEIAEKPMFMDAFQKRRCLIPADGYVRKSGRDGWPHVFEFPDQRLFAFAGVWDSGMNVESAAIITVASNEKNWRRMPLVLLPNDYTAWLDPNTESPALARLLQAAVQGIVAVRAECRNFNSDATPDVDQSTKSIW